MTRTARRWTIGLALTLAVAVDARADVIVLRGGGRIKGKVVPDPNPKKADRVQVIPEKGRTPLSVEKSRIQEVIEEAGPLDGYVVRRAAAPATAQGQFDLGSYCEQNKLPDLAKAHYEAAVKLDPAFGPAHEKLGHARVGDRWLSGDELREAQGMVKYRGRWITREEKEQFEKDGAAAAEGSSWVRRIRVWREAIAAGPDDRRREAEAQFMAVREPAAVKPLVKTLGNDNDDMRALLARVLGAIPGPEAETALATQLVGESAADVRAAFFDQLDRHTAQADPKAAGTGAGVKTLVQALHASTPNVVNRAAWALAGLKAVSTVPNLINALITTRQRTEWADPGNMGGGEGQGIGAAFGAAPYALAPGTPIAYNGSSVAYLTPPAVGPGAVAFGATAVPYYGAAPLAPLYGPANYGLGGIASGPGFSSFGVGAGNLGGSRGPVPRQVTDSFQNTEVLAALVKLTGRDFGYDQSAWQAWLRTSFRPDPKPARTVPQP